MKAKVKRKMRMIKKKTSKNKINLNKKKNL